MGSPSAVEQVAGDQDGDAARSHVTTVNRTRGRPHAVQGSTGLMQQDLAVLQRSISNVAESSNEVTNAAREGIREGLSVCTQ